MPGIAYGAAVSWCLQANRDLDVAAALDAHAFADDSGVLGRVVLDLGDVYTVLTPQIPNIATIVLHIYFPEVIVGKGPLHAAGAGEYEEARSRLAACRSRLAESHPCCDDASLVIRELTNAIDLVDLACDDALARLAGDGSIESVAQSKRDELASRMNEIIVRHRELWSARNRPGGLDDTVRRLEMPLVAYKTGDASRTWERV